ncbi:hypothetical protein Anapl_02298 [Anas platyrhynchos]|uniref:Uncharacterized protein n=1 Tax=Anas platyrhynchos TaxID=8839 RepID=R0M7W4_ANAPL|nr:hypothetical protein Anapl_02298 [Anas platyrhynchos]
MEKGEPRDDSLISPFASGPAWTTCMHTYGESRSQIFSCGLFEPSFCNAVNSARTTFFVLPCLTPTGIFPVRLLEKVKQESRNFKIRHHMLTVPTFINVQARGGKGRAEAKEEKMGVLWFSLLSGAAPLQVAALELPPSQSLAARRENVTAGWALREAAAEVYFWFLCWTGSFKDVSRGKIKAYTSPVFQSAANRSCQREEIFQVLPVALPKVPRAFHFWRIRSDDRSQQQPGLDRGWLPLIRSVGHRDSQILAAAGAQGVKDASAEDSAVQVEAASPADRAGTGKEEKKVGPGFAACIEGRTSLLEQIKAQSPANNLTVLRGYQMHTNWHQGEILCVQGAGADTGKPPCALWHITEPCRASLGKAALCGTVPASLFLTPLLRDQAFSMGTVPPLHTKGFCIQCHTMGRRRETANSTCLDHFAKYLDLLY